MFEVPFEYGAPWGAAEDEAQAPVIVITHELNEKLFGGANSVGRTVNLDDEDYRIIGVMAHWDPMPRFYDLTNDAFEKTAPMFLPFTRAIDRHMLSWGNTSCSKAIRGGLGRPAPTPTASGSSSGSSCRTPRRPRLTGAGSTTMPTSSSAAAASTGRRTRKLRDVRDWLTYEHVVSDEARILVMVSFSFLLVCVLNAMGLMLAKFMSRSADIGVRRALGANRRAIMAQCLIEAGVVGLAGGLLGIVLTVLGPAGTRAGA